MNMTIKQRNQWLNRRGDVMGMNWMKAHMDILLYLVFGVLTTLINVVVYGVCADVMHVDVMISTIIAWILAVLFAYVTNRKWVFHSTVTDKDGLIKELIAFFGCRLGTGVIDLIMMFVFVEIMKFPGMFIKFLANIFVIVLNYVASKVVIFKK